MVVPVFLLFLTNVLFHTEVIQTGTSDYSRRLAIALVIFLITLIGGRIIPSFTTNWLRQNGATAFPVVFNRFDRICLLVGAIALLNWSFWPTSMMVAPACTAVAALNILHLLRWQGFYTRNNPLLLMLHLAFAFIPAGFLALGIGSVVAAMHLWGIGAIGGMTLTVMLRATLGHTGRVLAASPMMIASFGLILIAALVRSLLPNMTIAGINGITLSAISWILGYGLVLFYIGPWLLSPKL